MFVLFLDVRPYRHTHADIYVYADGGRALNGLYVHIRSREKTFPEDGKFLLWWEEDVPPYTKITYLGGNLENSSRKAHLYCTCRTFVQHASIAFHKYQILIEASRTKA